MSWRIEIATTKAATSWTDRTSIIDRTSVRMGGEAFQARVGTGSGFNAADDAGTITVPGLRVVRMVEDATTPDTVLFRGRIGPKGLDRGTLFTGDSKEFDVACDDYNKDLGGLRVDFWSRPAETDVARVLALHADYLRGTASSRRGRASTDLDASTYIPNTFTTMLPAEVYRDTTPAGVLADIIGVTDKEAFITVDGELFYDRAISTAYAADIAISDETADGVDVYAPIPDGQPGEEDPSELVTRLTLKYGSANAYVEVVDADAENEHDRWETTVSAPEIKNAEKATRRANKLLSLQSDEETRYTCAIEIAPDQVDRVKYGQTIAFRWAAAGVLDPITLRIRRLIWEPPEHPEAPYVAHFELALPKKMGASIPGGPPGDPPGVFEPPDPAVNEIVCGTVLADGGVGIGTAAYGANALVKIERSMVQAGDVWDVEMVIVCPSGGGYAYVMGFAFSTTPSGGSPVWTYNPLLPGAYQSGSPDTTPPVVSVSPGTENGTQLASFSGFTWTQGMLDTWDGVYAGATGYLAIEFATSPGLATGGGQGYTCVQRVGGPNYVDPSSVFPYAGQPVPPEEITADGTTDTLVTNYPYQAGSLVVIDKATGQVLVVDQSGAADGEFTLGFTPAAGQVFVVWYLASGMPGTGAGNPLASAGTPSPAPTAGSSALWRPLMAYDPDISNYLVVVAGDGTAVMVEG